MSDNLFWLKLSASAALGAFALWKLFGEEDEPAELTNTQKLYFDLGLGGAQTDAFFEEKMKELLHTGEEQFLNGELESGVKYISTGVGIAAVIGSKNNATQLGLTLFQQYGMSLPIKFRDMLFAQIQIEIDAGARIREA